MSIKILKDRVLIFKGSQEDQCLYNDILGLTLSGGALKHPVIY